MREKIQIGIRSRDRGIENTRQRVSTAGRRQSGFVGNGNRQTGASPPWILREEGDLAILGGSGAFAFLDIIDECSKRHNLVVTSGCAMVSAVFFCLAL